MKVGYLYVRAGSLDEAIDRMRSGIQSYNAAHADRVRTGYHETLTVAFLHLITDAFARTPSEVQSADQFCDANPELLDRDILDRFYSREVLFGDAARRSFVPPDRKSLPGERPDRGGGR